MYRIEEPKVEKVEVKRRLHFQEVVENVMKVIHLQHGLMAVNEDVDNDPQEEAEVKNESTEHKSCQENDLKPIEEESQKEAEKPVEEAPVKLTEEELKKKMKSSLEFMIEQQALGQMETGSETSQQ